MNLNKDQASELVEAVEEELYEMELYKNLGYSEVCVLNIDGYSVYIKVVSDEYIPDEDE